MRKLEAFDLSAYDFSLTPYEAEVVAELAEAFSMAFLDVAPDLVPTEAQRLAVRYANARAGELLRLDGDASIAATTRARVRALVAQTIEQGESLRTLARNIRQDFAFSPQRATLIARTECLPAETSVDAAMIWAIHRRWYQGPMIEIVTECGRKFSATPNHPMFTGRGWLPVGEITEGDNLICYPRQQDFAATGDQNIQAPPATLSQIFDAVAAIGICERRRTGKPDFHGDGIEGDVDILYPSRFLRIGGFAPLYEPTIKRLLAPADAVRAPICRSCGRLLSITKQECLCGVADGDARFSQAGVDQPPSNSQGSGYSADRLAFKVAGGNHFRRELVAITPAVNASGDHIPVSFATSAHHPRFIKNFAYPLAVRLQGTSNAILSQSREIEIDYVLTVRQYAFSGHVYNLTTLHGYYTIGQGIMTGNTATALGQGGLQAGVAQGREEKRWITQGDDRVTPECQMNGAAGWIPIGDLFPTGKDTVPQHGNCRCDILTRHKSLAASAVPGRVPEFRCPAGHLLGKDVAPGTRLWCRKCKAEVVVKES